MTIEDHIARLQSEQCIMVDDPFAILLDYAAMLDSYITYFIQLEQISIDINDGLVVSEEEVAELTNKMLAAYSICFECKQKLGCEQDILNFHQSIDYKGIQLEEGNLITLDIEDKIKKLGNLSKKASYHEYELVTYCKHKLNHA